MSESKSSSRRIAAAERRTAFLDLRRAGLTFAEIGRRMSVSDVRAYQIVTDELARLNAERSEAAEAVRQLESDRLDALHAALWPLASKGNCEAIDRVLKVMARRAKLLGLDAPSRTFFAGAAGAQLGLRIVEETVDAKDTKPAIPDGAAAPDATSLPPIDGPL